MALAQIFNPTANVLAKLSLMIGAAVPVGLLFIGSTVSRSPSNTHVGVPAPQPIPFSHNHHAFELGIDCRYCHTTVEKGNFAGLPATEVCMSCHSQIWTNSPLLEPVRTSYLTGQPVVWTKVNKLPEFAYFDHSIHLARGINCNVCHGPVQKMPLMYKGRSFAMVWCLDCHRNPEKYIYKDEKHPEWSPRRQVFELYWKYQKNAPLTHQERRIMDGVDLPENSGVAEGKALAAHLGIKKKQLEDCWTCHR
jgi:hypothetical protein